METISVQELGNIIQCSNDSNCYLCRHKRLGRGWRQALCAKFSLPFDMGDFPCPIGKPWGYIPKDSPLTLEEQQKYVCSYCGSEPCTGTIESLSDCPEGKWYDTIHVVYPYFASEAESDELRYSLRSLRNLKEKPVVWIVGDKPGWLNTNEVRYIPHSRTSWNRDIDSAAKFKLAAEHPDMGNYFINMNDDIYFIAPVLTPFLAVPRYIADYTGNVESFCAESVWEKTCLQEFRVLEKRNLPVRDYCLHWPYVFRTDKFLDLYPEFQLDTTPHNLENIYYNFHADFPLPYEGGIVRVYRTISIPLLYRLTKSAVILNNKKDAFESVAGLLASLFPDQSPFELQGKKRKASIETTMDIPFVEEELGMSLNTFMAYLRSDIAGRNTESITFKDTSRFFKPLEHYTLVSVYQGQDQMIRWGCKRKTMEKTMSNNVAKIRKNSSFQSSLVANSKVSGIKFESIISERPVDITQYNIDDEYAQAGLKITFEGNELYLLPSDARASNYNSLREKICNLLQRSKFLSKRLHIDDFLKDTGKEIQCFLVSSFWLLEIDDTIIRDGSKREFPQQCKKWQPYHPVRS